MTATGARSPAIDRALSTELIARFRADLAAVWDGEGRLGLAVSGGPDSLALLLLGHSALPGRIAAATVDHGLRTESAAEAAMVARLCEELSVPHETLRVEVAPGNLQQEARTARYAALAEWMQKASVAALATAHHADDQAETLLMRLNRGSGLSGLAGVRAHGRVPGTALPLVRPLLSWRKRELEQIVADAGITAAQDSSNEDPRFDRVRMRHALADADWLDIPAIAKSASWLADADAALEQWCSAIWNDAASTHDGEVSLTVATDLPREVKLRLLSRALAEFDAAPRGSQVAELLDAIEAGERRNLAGVLVHREDRRWVLRREPPRR